MATATEYGDCTVNIRPELSLECIASPLDFEHLTVLVMQSRNF
ncbi:hypothetical protein VIBNIAM115_1480068 [Vibrio nigripulchritudo AM115]|nr:hypothetical protein VIBNIAM115_1480068 [Vibrio nigripulchritudo AM115]